MAEEGIHLVATHLPREPSQPLLVVASLQLLPVELDQPGWFAAAGVMPVIAIT
jgi:hypothetical protein